MANENMTMISDESRSHLVDNQNVAGEHQQLVLEHMNSGPAVLAHLTTNSNNSNSAGHNIGNYNIPLQTFQSDGGSHPMQLNRAGHSQLQTTQQVPATHTVDPRDIHVSNKPQAMVRSTDFAGGSLVSGLPNDVGVHQAQVMYPNITNIAHPSGNTLQNGVLSNITTQNGRLSNVAMPNGALSNVAMPNGALSNVAMPNGSLTNLMVQNGALPNVNHVQQVQPLLQVLQNPASATNTIPVHKNLGDQVYVVDSSGNLTPYNAHKYASNDSLHASNVLPNVRNIEASNIPLHLNDMNLVRRFKNGRQTTDGETDSNNMSSGKSRDGNDDDDDYGHKKKKSKTIKVDGKLTKPDDIRKPGDKTTSVAEANKQSQMNSYTIHKTAAQGAMNVAQFSMNVSQLKKVLDTGDHARYFYLLVVFICISITMQVGIGVVLLFVGARETRPHHEMSEQRVKRAMQTNRYAVALMFVVSCLNIVISIFYASVGTVTS